LDEINKAMRTAVYSEEDGWNLNIASNFISLHLP
jgi:hypothetical protein